MGDRALLGLIDIGESPRRGKLLQLPVGEADPGQCRVKMPLQKTVRIFLLKDTVRKLRHKEREALPELLDLHPGDHEAVITHDLPGGKTGDLIQKLSPLSAVRAQKLPGRDVCRRNAEARPVVEDAHQKIVLPLIEHAFACEGPRGDDPDHLSLYKALRQLRILHLLRDRDLVAAGDKPCNIAVRRVVGDAAHRRPLSASAVLPGQNEVQRLGGLLRILEEHLIEVADPVE